MHFVYQRAAMIEDISICKILFFRQKPEDRELDIFHIFEY